MQPYTSQSYMTINLSIIHDTYMYHVWICDHTSYVKDAQI